MLSAEIIMKKNEVTEVLRELNIATGFRLSLHNTEAEELFAYPTKMRGVCEKIQEDRAERALCKKCDNDACKRALEIGGTYSYKCRYGLTEIVTPIYNYNRLVGFLMMGQTVESEEEKKPADKKLAEIGAGAKERRIMMNEIPVIKKETATSFAKILTICAKYLTLSGAVYGATESIAESAMHFINENYTRRIHIKDVCAKLSCSKSTLLSSFKAEYGMTINTMLCKTRLEASRKMLAASKSVSINDIAIACGFSDQSYYCKVFSAEYGTSPSEYRRKVMQSADDGLQSLPSVCTQG